MINEKREDKQNSGKIKLRYLRVELKGKEVEKRTENIIKLEEQNMGSKYLYSRSSKRREKKKKRENRKEESIT